MLNPVCPQYFGNASRSSESSHHFVSKVKLPVGWEGGHRVSRESGGVGLGGARGVLFCLMIEAVFSVFAEHVEYFNGADVCRA